MKSLSHEIVEIKHAPFLSFLDDWGIKKKKKKEDKTTLGLRNTREYVSESFHLSKKNHT